MVNGEKVILTNSAINAFKSCAESIFGVMSARSSHGEAEALLLGTAIHGFLESHYRQLPFTPPST